MCKKLQWDILSEAADPSLVSVLLCVAARLGYLLFVPDLVSKPITHSQVVLCPAVNGNFVKGFHTGGTDLDVPAKKSISRFSLGATGALSSGFWSGRHAKVRQQGT